jgi:hypothetical protein
MTPAVETHWPSADIFRLTLCNPEASAAEAVDHGCTRIREQEEFAVPRCWQHGQCPSTSLPLIPPKGNPKTSQERDLADWAFSTSEDLTAGLVGLSGVARSTNPPSGHTQERVAG